MQPDAATNDLAPQIGARIKELRTADGLSGRKLAAAAGVSQPFLSQLESGQTSVAIATLYRIAGALDVSPSELLPASQGDEIEVLRAPELHRIPVSEAPHSTTGRTAFRSGKQITEFGDFLIEPGQLVEEWFESRGESVVYVIGGAIRIEFEGHPDVTLGEGDAVFYPAGVRSRWHLSSDSPSRVILVATRD